MHRKSLRQRHPLPNLLPVTRPQINRLARPHIFHDLLDAPWLVSVTLGIIRLKARLVLHLNTLLDAGHSLLIVLVRVGLGVVRPHPFGKFGCGAARIQFNLVPVGVLEKFGVGEPELLGARVSDEPVSSLVFQHVSRVDLRLLT